MVVTHAKLYKRFNACLLQVRLIDMVTPNILACSTLLTACSPIVVERVEHATMLGVTISNNLTWSKHVDNIGSKAGMRLYVLYQLKRARISQNELVKMYVSIIRPVLEYACHVWSTSLPNYVSDAVEMIHKRVLNQQMLVGVISRTSR